LKEKINGKISADIKKLQTNATKLVALFGGLKIRRWSLLVPRHESKDCTLHAALKRDEIRKLKLAHVTTDFEILIETEIDFPVELRKLRAVLHKLENFGTQLPAPTTGALSGWKVANSKFLSIAADKLAKAYPGDPAKQRETLEALVRSHVEGSNLLTKLKSEYPEVWEAVRREKAGIEESLSFESSVVPDTSPAKIVKARADLHAAIEKRVPQIDSQDIVSLSKEAVADWTFRCPLNF
jgi:hypothetical protein